MRNTTAVCNPRQNSVQDKIREFFSNKFFFVRGGEILSEKKFCQKKNSWILSWTEFYLGFPVHFF